MKQIVAVRAELASGPGWSNQLIHVIWRDENQALHDDWLQPEQWERSHAILALFSVAAQVAAQLERAVAALDPAEWRL